MPLVTFHNGQPATPCRPLHVALVGGSFMHQFAQILGNTACHPHFEQWEYWQLAHLGWPDPGEIYHVLTKDPALRIAGVLGADVVIYEENEQNMAHTNHGPAFLRFLQEAHGPALQMEGDSRPVGP